MTQGKEDIGSKNTIERSRYFRDRRKYPRLYMDLPLEYRMKYDPHTRGGIVIDASETGFLIYSTEDIPVGSKLRIAVFFPREYELTNFEVFTEIIWKKISIEKRGKGYQYGLRFVEILEEDHLKLKRLLSGRFK
jgi:hypothetical protein